MLAAAITTIDNPFDPFTQWDQWFFYDFIHGYDSCGKLARVAKVSESLSDKEYCDSISSAIDEIIAVDFRKIYKKVTREYNEESHVPIKEA